MDIIPDPDTFSTETQERIVAECGDFMADMLTLADVQLRELRGCIDNHDPEFTEPTLAKLARARVQTVRLLARIDGLMEAFGT